MEIACSEGVFTDILAPRVDNLMGVDISPTAIDRAQKRCQKWKHVQFMQLDLMQDPLPGRFDLIVCSEVLYFMGGRHGLERTAHKLAKGLRVGGYLIMANMNLLKDDPNESGFDWTLDYGGRVIREVFQETYPLRLVKEMKFPLYRIDLFQRLPAVTYLLNFKDPEIIEVAKQPTALSPDLQAHVQLKVLSTKE